MTMKYMNKTIIISVAAALLLAGAALTAMSVRADKTDSLTENNIEALAIDESSNGIDCWDILTHDNEVDTRYCRTCSTWENMRPTIPDNYKKCYL